MLFAEKPDAALFAVCPDCKGAKKLALMLSVVDCKRCGGRGWLTTDSRLDTPISELNLSMRLSVVLRSLEVASVGDLLRLTEEKLQRDHNVGESCLSEIREHLDRLGLKMRAI